jgi:hypothetical protein
MCTFMIARLKLRFGQVEALSEVMADLVPILEARGWKLLAAYQTLIGDLNEVIDVWEVPDANAAYLTSADAAASDPEFGRLASRLAEMVVGEHLSIMTTTTYGG